ncbi:MAG: hypothetical protein KAJ43_01630 [Gemmatimonadetes bacterium]|nr:hypothetical protein [Gemmatimonadota bacterium]
MSLLDHIPIAKSGPALLGALAIGLLSSQPAIAQRSSSDRDIRVVETVDPVSGARYRQAVYDLTKKEIKAVQRALRETGYLGVGWTGQLDHGTIKALNELQQERGLYQCGCVSYETIVALGLKPAVQVTTVAVGGTSGSAYGSDDWYRSGYRSGIYYPIAVPIFVPVDPENPDGPTTEIPANGEATTPRFPPPRPAPPGVRPLPPIRVIPAGSRSGYVPIPAP